MVAFFMRVLHVITDTNIGGAGRYLLNLLSQPAFAQIEVILACPDGELGKRIDSAGFRRSKVSAKDISFSPSFTLEIGKLIRQTKPDIVHTHASLSGRIAAKGLGVPVVYTKHGLTINCPSPRGTKPPGFFQKFLNNLASRLLSDAIIAISQGVYDDLVGAGVETSRVWLVLHGVDLDEFKPRDPLKRLDDGCPKTVVVGTLARLDPVKGLDVFIEAAQMVIPSCPQARFIIAGTGFMEKALKAKIRELRLDSFVQMAGFVHDVSGFLSDLDIFVLPSLSEGLGLSVLEAMAQGLPVIATRVGGIPEAVEDGVTGILVEPGNPRLLAQSIARLAIDPQLAAGMGLEGRERAQRLFDAKLMAQNTVDVYRKVFEGGKRRGLRL